MKKLLIALLCLFAIATFWPVASLADDAFVINVDTLDFNSLKDAEYIAQHLSAQTQGIRVQKYISDSDEFAARVRLTVTQAETNTVVFDKNYGYVSGVFDSDIIYLPYLDNNVIPYIITLNVETWTYAMPFMHQQQRLSYNSACTYGVRMRDYNPSLTNDWVMGTMLNLDTLRQTGSETLSVCASNQYIVGQSTVTLQGDWLTVSLAFLSSTNVEVHSCAVYLFKDVSALTTLDPSAIRDSSYGVGQAIDVSGLHTALLYLPITLSYDPSGLYDFSYGLSDPMLSEQLALWDTNLQQSVAGESQQDSEPEASVSIDSGETPAEDIAPSTPDGDTDSALVLDPS